MEQQATAMPVKGSDTNKADVDAFRANVIATAVDAIGAAESAVFAACVDLSFVHIADHAQSVYGAVKDNPRLGGKAIKASVLASLAFNNRAIFKGEAIPPIVCGNMERAIEYAGSDGELRTQVKTFLAVASALARTIWANHKNAITGMIGRVASQEECLTEYRAYVVEHIASNMADLERRITKPKADKPVARGKLLPETLESYFEKLDEKGFAASADEIRDAIALLNNRLLGMVAPAAPAAPAEMAEAA